MKRILVTGEKSYIGVSFNKWLSQWPDKYSVEYISIRNEDWKLKDFSNFDALIHVAAIVHKKEQPEMNSLYERVNKGLTIELAKKAKLSGIKQFIFMSSMSVYGIEGKIGKDVIIDKDFPCIPNTLYGKSKLDAENEIRKMDDENFCVSIIRAPMIYGPNCPGNYNKLKNLILKLPIFPLINNQRSMLFIDNLSELLRLLIENRESGMFFPQNKEYVNTNLLAKLISKENNHTIFLSRLMALGVLAFFRRIKIFNKVFGSLVFEKSLSNYMDFNYCVVDFEKSIEICETIKRNGC